MHRLLLQRACELVLVGVTLGGAVAAAGPHTAHAAPQAANPAAEAWIRSQIARGQAADLQDLFPTPSERRISAPFLVGLLTTPLAAGQPLHRVEIHHAIVGEQLDLAYLEVLPETICQTCEFEAGVNLVHATLRRSLSLAESTFGGPADFSNVHANDTVTLDGATFADSASFYGAAFDDWLSVSNGHFQATVASVDFGRVRAQRSVFFDGVTFAGGLDCHGLKIDGSFSGQDAVFDGAVDFTGAMMTGALSLDRAKFSNPQEWVNFNAATVGTDLLLRDGVEFHGPVDFQAATIGLNLVSSPTADDKPGLEFDNGVNFDNVSVGKGAFLVHTAFRGEQNVALFESMHVGSIFDLSGSVFEGGANFTRADIKGDLTLDRARFTSAGKLVNFNAATIGIDLFLRDVEFSGPVDFRDASIGVDLATGPTADGKPPLQFDGGANFADVSIGKSAFLAGSRFTGANNSTSFYALKVGSDLELAGAAFDGPVDFTRADIKGEFTLDSAQFNNAQESVNFNTATIGTYLWLRGAVRFHGPVAFDSATIGNALVAVRGPDDGTGVEFDADVSLADVTIGRSATLNNARFLGETNTASFWAMHVGRNLDLVDTVFEGQANFSRADIKGDLTLDRARFASAAKAVNFNAATIGTDLWLRDGVEFHGPVDFRDASIGVDLATLATADGKPGVRFDGGANFTDVNIGKSAFLATSRFTGPSNSTSFYAVKVGSDLELARAAFDGAVDFTRADIKGQFTLDGAQFNNAQESVNFNTATIGTYLWLRNGVSFHGPVDFTDMTVGANVDASLYPPAIEPTRFFGRLSAQQLKIGKGLYMQQVIFDGPVSFRSSTIGGSLLLTGAHFNNTNYPTDANFEAIQTSNIVLDDAEFGGAVTFFDTQVAQSMSAAHTCFRSQYHPVNFGGMKVGDLGSLIAARFNGPVDFTTSSFTRVDFRGVRWGLRNAVADDCPAGVGEYVAPADDSATVQPEGNARNLFGFSYQALYAYDPEDPLSPNGQAATWKDAFSVLQHGRYESADYTRAEAYLKQAGHQIAADDTFVAHEDWERDHVLGAVSAERLVSAIKGWLVGYGRHPANALAWGAVIVVGAWIGLGVWSWTGGEMTSRRVPSGVPRRSGPFPTLFGRFKRAWPRPWRMLPGDIAEAGAPTFNWFPHGLLYALDVFAPVINLKLQEDWRPKSDRLDLAEKVLTILGWVVVPLGVAGITGLVK